MKVWVNGTFDVLHIGHIKLLKHAAKFGELRVGIDTDERVKSKKGEGRPFNTLQDRISFLLSIKYVNSVVHFDSDEELISKIKEYDPEIMVIGSDYMGKEIIGAHLFERVIFFDRIEDKSTSKILNYESTNNRRDVY